MIEASAFYEEVLGHVPIGQINSAWFQCIMHPRYSPTSPLSKRLLDLAVAVPMLVLATPLILGLAAMVKLSDGGPAFFRQRRVGEQGREFEIVEAADDDRRTPPSRATRCPSASSSPRSAGSCARRTSTSYRSSGTSSTAT